VSEPGAKEALTDALEALVEGDGDMGELADSIAFLTAYLNAFAAPGFVCGMVPIPPNPAAEYEGVGGVAEAWRDWGATFETVRGEAIEIIDGPDAVVLFVNQIAVTKHGGVEISQPSAILVKFRDGLASRLEFHLDRDAAPRAGGIPAGPG